MDSVPPESRARIEMIYNILRSLYKQKPLLFICCENYVTSIENLTMC